MVVCKFYLQGNCKFGDRCRNEHPRNLNDYNQAYRGNNQNYSNNFNQGGRGGYNTGYNNANYQRGGYSSNYGGQQQQQPRQDQFHWRGGQQQSGRDQAGKTVSFQNSFGGNTSNSFAALDPGGGGGATSGGGTAQMKPAEIIDIIKKDIEEWENGKMWPLSCYKPTRSQHCVPGFEDITQDELRYTAYTAEKQQKFEQYKTAVATLMSTVQQQKDQLKQPSSELSSRLVDIFKGIYQAGSNVSLGNGDSMFQGLVTVSGASNTQATAAGSKQQGTSFGSATPAATPATGSTTSGFPTSSGFGSTSFGNAQGAASTSGFGSASFGKPAAPGGFGTGNTGGFGSSGSGLGNSGTGLFGKGGSAPSSTQPPSGLFGKGPAPGGAAPTGAQPAGTGLFGKGAPAGTGLFGKPAAPGSGGAGIFGQSSGAVDSTVYTPLTDLTAEEKEQFEADVFIIGKIPTRPPPIELVR